MKKALFLIITCFLYSPVHSLAQEWNWGAAPKFSSAVAEMGGFYGGPMAVDPSGNVFTSCSSFNLHYSVFGADTLIPDRSWLSQAIVSKSDSTGAFLWATGTHGANAAPIGIATNGSGRLYVLGMYNTDTACIIGPDTLTYTSNGYNPGVFFLAKIGPSGNVI